jgi:hypothetical protein
VNELGNGRLNGACLFVDLFSSVSQHAASTHMDSSNLAVLWWPNLLQPQFTDLLTAEQKCQTVKPLIQAIIDNYSAIFESDVDKPN